MNTSMGLVAADQNTMTQADDTNKEKKAVNANLFLNQQFF